jgi:Holliday junction resolvasome RuvABC endonuclease subunit
MLVLGLDPSLTDFGWALHDTEAKGRDRCPERGRFQTSTKTLFIDRYRDLRERVRTLVKEKRPDRVSIEYPVFGELYTAGMYGLFLFTCEALHAERMDVVFWAPLQIKSHAREAIGRPSGWRMDKPDMIEAAREDTGGGRWNHNEADAYLAALLGARFWLLYEQQITEDDLTPTEKRMFTEVHRYVRGKKAGREEKRGVLYREDERFFTWSQES